MNRHAYAVFSNGRRRISGDVWERETCSPAPPPDVDSPVTPRNIRSIRAAGFRVQLAQSIVRSLAEVGQAPSSEPQAQLSDDSKLVLATCISRGLAQGETISAIAKNCIIHIPRGLLRGGLHLPRAASARTPPPL
jgi:hypothetical protein